MRIGKVGEAEGAKTAPPVTDQDRGAVEVQFVDQVGGEEGCGGFGPALDEEVLHAFKAGDALRASRWP